MSTAILTLTLRQLLGQRRALLMVGLAALPVIVAIAFRIGDPDVIRDEWVANVLLKGLIVTAVLPLCALIFGTTALGSEIENGTAVYLLSKPVPRYGVIGAKLGAASLVAVVLVSLSTAVSATIARTVFRSLPMSPCWNWMRVDAASASVALLVRESTPLRRNPDMGFSSRRRPA